MIGRLDAKIPHGPLAQKWTNHRDHARLVAPNNRRKFEIIVVGSGLAGGAAATRTGGAPAFYADLVRGASPHVMLANLKGQVDQLATRVGTAW